MFSRATSGVCSSASTSTVPQFLGYQIATTCLWAFKEPPKPCEPTVANLPNDGFNPQESILGALAQELADVRKLPIPKGERQAFPVRLAAARLVIAKVLARIKGLNDGAFKTELAPVLAAISAFELSAAEADEFFA